MSSLVIFPVAGKTLIPDLSLLESKCFWRGGKGFGRLNFFLTGCCNTHNHLINILSNLLIFYS